MMPAMEHDLSSRRWLILASTVVSFFAVGVTFFAVPPLIPELVTRFGLSHLAIGVLMGAISVPAVLFSIPVGAAVDRWPARAAGNVALSLMGLGALIFALAPSYVALFVGRLLFGVGGLVINLLLARLVTTAFAGRELALAMGIFNAVYPASMIAMFTLHPKLLAALGWRGELLVLAALVAVAVPLHNIAVPKALRGEAATKEDRGERRITAPLVALAVSWMLFFAAYASIFTFAPEWAGGGGTALLTVSLIPWVALFLAPLAGAVIDRTGRAAPWVLAGQLILCGVLAAMALRVIPPVPAKPSRRSGFGGTDRFRLRVHHRLFELRQHRRTGGSRRHSGSSRRVGRRVGCSRGRSPGGRDRRRAPRSYRKSSCGTFGMSRSA